MLNEIVGPWRGDTGELDSYLKIFILDMRGPR